MTTVRLAGPGLQPQTPLVSRSCCHAVAGGGEEEPVPHGHSAIGSRGGRVMSRRGGGRGWGGARWRHFRGWPARALRSPLQGAIPSAAVRVHDVDAQAPSPTRALRGPRSRPPLPRREAAAGDAILAPNGPERPVVYTRRRRLAHGTQRGGPAGGGTTLAPASPLADLLPVDALKMAACPPSSGQLLLQCSPTRLDALLHPASSWSYYYGSTTQYLPASGLSMDGIDAHL